MLDNLRQALAALTERCYHYFAYPGTTPPYIVWAEDGDNDLAANNIHAERCFEGTIDLFTKTEGDSLFEAVPAALESIGAAYYLNSVQYEEDTGLLHYEWVWQYG